MFAPDLMLEDRSIISDVRAAYLAPAQLKGLTTGYILDPYGDIVGLVTVGANRGSDRLLREHAAPLSRLCGVMGQTLSLAIQVATELGYLPTGKLPRIFRLSPRERQVAELATEGFTPLNIGAHLGISEYTVRVHLKNIYRKLEIHSRVDLVRSVMAVPPRRNIKHI